MRPAPPFKGCHRGAEAKGDLASAVAQMKGELNWVLIRSIRKTRISLPIVQAITGLGLFTRLLFTGSVNLNEDPQKKNKDGCVTTKVEFGQCVSMPQMKLASQDPVRTQTNQSYKPPLNQSWLFLVWKSRLVRCNGSINSRLDDSFLAFLPSFMKAHGLHVEENGWFALPFTTSGRYLSTQL